jgi:hypothetical protein
MCRALRSVNLYGLTFHQTVEALKMALQDLHEIATETDFNNPAHISQFKANIKYIKSYYEKIEKSLRYEPD